MNNKCQIVIQGVFESASSHWNEMSFTSGVKKVNEEQVMNSMTMKNMGCTIAKGMTFLLKLGVEQ